MIPGTFYCASFIEGSLFNLNAHCQCLHLSLRKFPRRHEDLSAAVHLSLSLSVCVYVCICMYVYIYI